MAVNITFIYEKRTISIQCKQNEGINSIYQKFVNKLNPNSNINDFDYFYEGQKLGKNIQNLKDFLQENQKDVNISVEKRTKVVKCPECICNDCMIDIDDYIIKFYGCKYKHVDYKIFDDYKSSQKIDFSKIFCKFEGCKKDESNDPEDFYKCLTCGKILHHTQYYCSVHSKEHDKNNESKHIQVKYDHRNYYCTNHYKNFIKYCFKCGKNLCENCLEEHKDHQIKDYNTMTPNIKEFEDSLLKIKQKIQDLKYIIDYIKHHILDGTMKIFENYCSIVKDIIEKYKLNNMEFKNYGILKTFFNLKKSNKEIMYELDKIIKEDSYKDKIDILLNMFSKKWDNYKNLNNKANNIKKVNDLDDFLEWEGKNVKKDKNQNHSDQKENFSNEKRKTDKSSNKYKKKHIKKY